MKKEEEEKTREEDNYLRKTFKDKKKNITSLEEIKTKLAKIQIALQAHQHVQMEEVLSGRNKN